nr:hypothetical protein 3 [Moraxellaceae bacterium]
MAIQRINLGTAPSGTGGDTNRSAFKKIDDNFADSANAASRLVGTAWGQLPLAEQVRSAMYTRLDGDKLSGNVNDFENGTIYYVESGVSNAPVGFSAGTFIIETRLTGTGRKYQLALGWSTLSAAHRTLINNTWSEWQPLGWDAKNYSTTSATAANVVVDSAGRLMRATSSLKYKNVIADLVIDDELYEKALNVNPIIYRSKSEIDPKDWHYMSFSAEQLGELDPALTQWLVKTHDDDGNELDKPIKEAEGINLNAICAVLHATNIYQDKKIKELEQRLTALESANEPIE